MDKDLFGICPFVTAQRVLAGKWAIIILHHLSTGTVRFNELQRRLPETTHATLSRQLKQLEEDGLIARVEYPQIPPKVEYSLSEIGKRFMPVLECLAAWGNEYIDYLHTKERIEVERHNLLDSLESGQVKCSEKYKKDPKSYDLEPYFWSE